MGENHLDGYVPRLPNVNLTYHYVLWTYNIQMNVLNVINEKKLGPIFKACNKRKNIDIMYVIVQLASRFANSYNFLNVTNIMCSSYL